jgi:hypothetical protein
MASTISTVAVITLYVTILFLIHTIFQNLLPLYFAQAQNSTASQNITYQNIPTTRSIEAQEELRKITFDPSFLKVPSISMNENLQNNQDSQTK